ncbi:MAG: hypothetical protein K2O63_02170 [Alistipes sp.]|nr:hypothetical protein [Alistipes sp.]
MTRTTGWTLAAFAAAMLAVELLREGFRPEKRIVYCVLLLAAAGGACVAWRGSRSGRDDAEHDGRC